MKAPWAKPALRLLGGPSSLPGRAPPCGNQSDHLLKKLKSQLHPSLPSLPFPFSLNLPSWKFPHKQTQAGWETAILLPPRTPPCLGGPEPRAFWLCLLLTPSLKAFKANRRQCVTSSVNTSVQQNNCLNSKSNGMISLFRTFLGPPCSLPCSCHLVLANCPFHSLLSSPL